MDKKEKEPRSRVKEKGTPFQGKERAEKKAWCGEQF